MASSSVREHRDVWSVCDDFEKLGIDSTVRVDDYVDDGYENPIAWQRRYNVNPDLLTKDVLFDNMDMKDITTAQYTDQPPEFIKWKLFGYNIVICHEFVVKGKMDKALQTIHDIEKILESIEICNTFLKSIELALNHITYSMKGHILKLCSITTTKLKPFCMSNEMDSVNRAGLFGIQSLFFYEYDLPCAHLSKNSAHQAITLNEMEAEWHYQMARVLTHWQRACGNYFECSQQEIYESEMAVKLGDKDHHKLHLVQVYSRMMKNFKKNQEAKAQIMNEACKLLTKVMSNTNDLLLLKGCLISLSKFSHDRNNFNFSEILEELVARLKSSNNAYIHGAIGNYYLFYKRDYEKANFYLKKAAVVKSFGCSIDYIYTFFKINPKTAPVEQMMVDLLKTFTHPVHQEKLLSQIVSYLIITQNNLIQALKYIPKLLTLKHVTCVYSMLTHRTKFYHQTLSINLIDLLSEKLYTALNDQTLSTFYLERVIEVVKKFETFKLYVSALMKEKHQIFGNDFNKDSKIKRILPSNDNESKESFKHPSYKPTYSKKDDDSNWRTLKPDLEPNTSVFSRGQKTQYNGLESKSYYNFYK